MHYRKSEFLEALEEKVWSGNMLVSPYTGATGPLAAYGLRDQVRERFIRGGESGGRTVCAGSVGMRIVALRFCLDWTVIENTHSIKIASVAQW